MPVNRRPMESPCAVSCTPRSLLACFVALACVISLGADIPALAAAADKKPKQSTVLKGLPITDLSEDEAVLHALNRLAYGPRPGDVEHVRQMGLAKWIDQQLNPNSIDDHVVEARLANYPTLHMSTGRLMSEYPRPNQAELARQQAAQREGRPGQPARSRPDAAAEVVAKDSKVDQRPAPDKEQIADTSAATAGQAAPENPDAPAPMKQPAADNPPSAQVKPKDALLGGGDPNQFPRAVAEDSKRPQRIIAELSMAKMTRAIYSDRQLDEVMSDFWFNHFNVFAGKGQDVWMLTSYERDVIRPHALGKFKDLVTATAKSPAMLFYLDNWMSADPRAAERLASQRAARQNRRRGPFSLGMPSPQRNPQQQGQGQRRGLNENYGRELMELHTLGVDGGYTQKDVTEVARCFTGWTLREPRRNPEFYFEDRLHDPDPKHVLGKTIHAGGVKDGEAVIDFLVHHRSTAKFVSTKLARRFVSDNPPPALVERMAKTFQSSDGDVRAVLKTMIYSPEFWSRDAFRAKIKTPFELVVSATRAVGADVSIPLPLVMWVARIGQPLYQCQPPTGYSDKAEAWVNTGALLNRLNFSLALASNRLRGSRTDLTPLFGKEAMNDPKAALDGAVLAFLGGQAMPQTVETLQKQLDNPQVLRASLDDPVKQVDTGLVAGLVLGAPEFQRR
jgi:uncharacterized protein (DUF1800 family)